MCIERAQPGMETRTVLRRGYAMSEHERWEEHTHEPLDHSHAHHHVTHNLNQRTGGFDHLSSEHEHLHDHAGVSHAHYPHQDFEHEHRFEAHDHDHGEAVKKRAPRKPAAKKTPARKSPAKKLAS